MWRAGETSPALVCGGAAALASSAARHQRGCSGAPRPRRPVCHRRARMTNTDDIQAPPPEASPRANPPRVRSSLASVRIGSGRAARARTNGRELASSPSPGRSARPAPAGGPARPGPTPGRGARGPPRKSTREPSLPARYHRLRHRQDRQVPAPRRRHRATSGSTGDPSAPLHSFGTRCTAPCRSRRRMGIARLGRHVAQRSGTLP